MKFRTIAAALAATVSMSLITASGAWAQAARTLKVAHVFATDHPVHLGLLKADALLKERSGGKLSLQIFPAGTYANYVGALQAVRLGALDMAPLDTAIEHYPASGALLAPYLFRDYDHWRAFKKSDVYRELRETISDKVGVRQLAMYTFGFRHVTTGKVKAMKPADYEKMKLRVVNFAPYPEVATVLGASGTPIPIGDLYLALANGVADAQENPFTQILTMKLNEVQKYLVLTGHILATSGTVMSKRAWSTLNDAEKKIVEEVFAAQADWIDQQVIAGEQKMLDELRGKGMEVVQVDKAPFVERVPLVLKKYPDFTDLYQKIQAIK